MKTKQMTTKLLSLLLIGAALTTACKKEGCTDETATNYEASAKKDDGSCQFEDGGETTNTAPTQIVFENAPSNEATDISSPLTITWLAATDKEGDEITYDVFLGTDSNNPELVSENQSGLSFETESLDLATVYYLRVDAKSGEHITPSEVRSFTTSNVGSYVDSRDAYEYGTIKIGDQVWMTSNLVYNSTGSYSYDDNTTNDANYGRLYEWANVSAAIPGGWHLPTDEEWKALETELGMPAGDLNINNYSTPRGTDQGTQLREGGSSGLNFPLAGFRSNGSYSALGNRTYLWVNSTVGSSIFRRRLVTGDPSCYRFTNPAGNFAISVRLVKD